MLIIHATNTFYNIQLKFILLSIADHLTEDFRGRKKEDKVIIIRQNSNNKNLSRFWK